MKSSSPQAQSERYRTGAVGYLLNRTAHLVAATFEQELKKDGISLSLWRVLTSLTHVETPTLSELATHVGAELSYLSRVVIAAEVQGYVQRLATPGDRRSTRVSITSRGRAVFRKFSPRAQSLEDLCVSGMSAREIEALRTALRLIYDNVLAGHPASPAEGRKLLVARRVNGRLNEGSEGAVRGKARTAAGNGSSA